MAAWTEAKPSLWPGKCQWDACPIDGGRFIKGDLIRWSRKKGDKGVTFHDRCHPDNRDGQWDRRNAQEQMRGQGGIFEAADEAERDAIVTQPVFSANAQASRSGQMPANAFPSHDPMAVLANALLPHLEGRIGGGVDPDEVLALIEQHLNGAILKTVVSVEVYNHTTGDAIDMGIQHRLFPLLMKMVGARRRDDSPLNFWIAGPAGTGKTTAARKVAEALGYDFLAYGAQDNPYGLLGFEKADSAEYKPTLFEKAWKGGKTVILWDETDAWTASAFMPFNAGLANGCIMFPDGMGWRSDTTIIICCANTWGGGATVDYVGRNKLDRASMNRFAKLFWPIDEALELATCGHPQWCEHVQKIRANAAIKALKVLITPRQTYDGIAFLDAGLTWEEAEMATMRFELSDDQWRMIAPTSNQGGLGL